MRVILCILLCACTTIGWAQRSAEVHAVEQLALPESSSLTLQQAFQQAIVKAQDRAIRDEFGTMVTSTTQMEMRKEGNANTSNLWNFTELSAKGEWLAHTKTPEIKNVTYQDGTLFITAEVWGEAREILHADIDLDWRLLRTDPDGSNEELHYTSGDRMFISFKTPSDGYLVAYLIGADGKAFRLLPYKNSDSGAVMVKGGKHYVFYDRSRDVNARYLNLTTSDEVEANQVVVVFSTQPFIHGMEQEATSARTLASIDYLTFQKWLARNRQKDSTMTCKSKTLYIHRK